jgi:hypothetical protein
MKFASSAGAYLPGLVISADSFFYLDYYFPGKIQNHGIFHIS